VGSLVMGCIVDRSCVHRPRPPLRAEDRRLTDKRPVDPRPLRVAVDPATRHAVADLNVATYYLAGRRHSDRYQADPLQRLRFRSNRHRHVRRGFGGAPMRHPVDSGLSTRGTRGGGFVVWTADDDDSWRTMTAVVICVGSVLAVFGLLPLSVHGPLHFYGVMDPLCGATRAVRLALRGDLGTSWRYNPVGAPLAALSVLLLVRDGVGRFWGRWITVRVHLSRTATLTLVGIGLLLVVGLEVNQQMHSALLMGSV
jgi:hypothetical protein